MSRREKDGSFVRKFRNGPGVEGCLCVGTGGGLYRALASPSPDLNRNVLFFGGNGLILAFMPQRKAQNAFGLDRFLAALREKNGDRSASTSERDRNRL